MSQDQKFSIKPNLSNETTSVQKISLRDSRAINVIQKTCIFCYFQYFFKIWRFSSACLAKLKVVWKQFLEQKSFKIIQKFCLEVEKTTSRWKKTMKIEF